MSALWTTAEIAGATGGRPTAAAQDLALTGVSIDSRTVAPGDLFIALHGPRHDGHDHVAAALNAGAGAALVAHVPPGLDNAPLIVVADTGAGLTAMGAAARARTHARVTALTGSVGKTGTKEALARLFAVAGPTHATPGNFNNDIGVPVSLARMPRDTAFAAFELGMNHPGEIAPLARLVRPRVALITAIAPAHIEFFDSVEAIADEKARIMLGLAPGGIAVLPRDSSQFPRLADHAAERNIEILDFGFSPAARAHVTRHDSDAEGSTIEAEIDGRPVSWRLALPGRHWVTNTLGALAVTAALGLDPAALAPALADMVPLKGRGERHQLAWGDGTITLFDESYNASPAAVRAALEVLGGLTPGPGGRRVAVLGDMLELGDRAPGEHAALAVDADLAGIDRVHTAGPLSAAMHQVLPAGRRGHHAADAAALAPLVIADLRPGDLVMVKGSAGSRTGRIVEALIAAAKGEDA